MYSFSCFVSIYLSVCCFVQGNVCWKCAHCFVLSILKSVQPLVSFDLLFWTQLVISDFDFFLKKKYTYAPSPAVRATALLLQRQIHIAENSPGMYVEVATQQQTWLQSHSDRGQVSHKGLALCGSTHVKEDHPLSSMLWESEVTVGYCLGWSVTAAGRSVSPKTVLKIKSNEYSRTPIEQTAPHIC